MPEHVTVTTNKSGNLKAEVLKVNPRTMIVKLPDGNVIKRQKHQVLGLAD